MRKIGGLFLDCLGGTSVRGVPRIVKHKNLCLRTFWTLSVLFMGSLSGYCVLLTIMRYLDYSPTTVIRNAHAITTDIPDVTFCNMNPLSSTGESSGGVTSLQDYTDMVMVDMYRSGYVREGYRPDPETERLLSQMLSLQGYFQYIGQSKASKVGHQLRDFLVACDILYGVSSSERGKVECEKYTDVQLYMTAALFNCYTFRVDYDRVLAEHGLPVGVSVILHLDSSQDRMTEFFDTNTDSTQASGVRMSVHPPNTVPDLWFRPLDAPPGHFTNIQHQLVIRKRLGPPHGECESHTNTVYFGLEGQVYHYTKPTCLNACAQEAIAEQCACFDPALVVTESRDNLQLPFCGAYGGDVNVTMKRMRCASQARLAGSVTECIRKCTDDCNEAHLPSFATLSVWPRRSQRLWFYERMIKMQSKSYAQKYQIYDEVWGLIHAGNETEARDKLDKTTLIEDNFLKITSSLQSMEATILEDKPRNTITTLMSEIGGILNLYSGVSLIVLIECLELMYRLLALPWGAVEKSPGQRVTDAQMDNPPPKERTTGFCL